MRCSGTIRCCPSCMSFVLGLRLPFRPALPRSLLKSSLVDHQSEVSTLAGWSKRPIQPVMDSRRLSAAGIRFLRFPLPTGELGLPCGWLTDFSDPSGFTTFRNSRRDNWFRCLLYCVGLVSTSRSRQNWFHFLLGKSKFFAQVPWYQPSFQGLFLTQLQSKIYVLHHASFSLALAFPYGSVLTIRHCPQLSHGPVTKAACEDWEQAGY